MPEKHAIGAPPLSRPRLAQPHRLACAGRFGSEFVENRRLGLQNALNKIVSHPMLVGDPDLRLFLESDSFDIDVSTRSLYQRGSGTDEGNACRSSSAKSIRAPTTRVYWRA